VLANYHQLHHANHNFWGIAALCFGDEALIIREIATWVTFMDANKLTLNEAYKINRDVGGKICGQIDRSLSSLLGSMILANNGRQSGLERWPAQN
jgi:hypothetical protein